MQCFFFFFFQTYLLLAGAIHSSPSDVTGPLPSFSSYSNALNKSLLAVILFYYLPLLEREMQRDCSATSLMSHQSKTRKDGMEKKKDKMSAGIRRLEKHFVRLSRDQDRLCDRKMTTIICAEENFTHAQLIKIVSIYMFHVASKRDYDFHLCERAAFILLHKNSESYYFSACIHINNSS